jgi:hypothetical protein
MLELYCTEVHLLPKLRQAYQMINLRSSYTDVRPATGGCATRFGHRKQADDVPRSLVLEQGLPTFNIGCIAGI